VAEQASAPSTAASLHIDPASLAAAAGTAIQLIESPGVVRSLGLTDLGTVAGLRARLTTAVVGVGGSLGAAYVVWLLVNYSLARYSLLLLPSFDPLDIYCLLSLAKRERRLAN
jgi:hypothetical protein